MGDTLTEGRMVAEGLKYAKEAARAAARRWPWLLTRDGMDGLISDACLAVARCLKGYDASKGEWSHYCRRSISLMMVNAVRDRARWRDVMGGDPLPLDFDGGRGPLYSTIEDRRDSREAGAGEAVQAVLACLTGFERYAVEAVFLEGKSMRQAGLERGVTKQMVHHALRRAWRKVQAKYTAEGLGL